MYEIPSFPGQCSSTNLGVLNFSMRYPYLVDVHAPFFATIRLHSKNFLLQILNLTESQGCLGFIDGIIPFLSPSVFINNQFAPSPDFFAWQRTDELITGLAH